MRGRIVLAGFGWLVIVSALGGADRTVGPKGAS